MQTTVINKLSSDQIDQLIKLYRNELWCNKLGNVLMDEIISHPKLKQIPHFDLYCLPEMNEFYQQFGFTTELNGLGVMRRDNS